MFLNSNASNSGAAVSELYDEHAQVSGIILESAIIFISERIMIFLAFHVMKQNINVYACFFYNMGFIPVWGHDVYYEYIKEE